MTPRVCECRSCGAEILWGTTPRGSKMPVDADPSPSGEWLLREDGSLEHAPAGYVSPDLYTSHFATCPNALQHRRPRP